MKKLLALSLIGASFLVESTPSKADWDFWGIKENPHGDTDQDKVGTYYYLINSNSGEETEIFKHCPTIGVGPSSGTWSCGGRGNTNNNYIDDSSGKLIIEYSPNNYQSLNETKGILESGNYSANWASNYDKTYQRPNIRNENGNKIFEISGSKMIEKKSDGSIHIGENSAVFKEENGREKFWAQDANGKSIPIDITNGSKLLINGRDVEQSINNVGALSAALTGLPTVPTDTTLACGLGTGTHGGDFAFSGGCASKINEKISINYAASMTMPGQDYAGDFENQFSARAGFVWKLGKAIKPTQISMKEKENFKNKIESLEEKNKQLLSRLERLEKIALKEIKSKDLAIYKLK